MAISMLHAGLSCSFVPVFWALSFADAPKCVVKHPYSAVCGL